MAVNILHLGDMHVGNFEGEAARLDKIVGQILAMADKVDVVLIAGDIVHDGQEEQFKLARKILNPLFERFDTFLVPGNHDYGFNGIHAKSRKFEKFKKYFYGCKENVSYPHINHDKEGNVYIGLNSMYEESDGLDGLLADGELGRAQIAKLSGIIKCIKQDDPSKKIIVHLHHHPFLFPDEGVLDKIGEVLGHWLKDGGPLMSTISSNRVDLLLFGHEHRHLNFSETRLSEKFDIPCILSAGKLTMKSEEFKVTKDGRADTESPPLHEGFLARIITLDGPGREYGTDIKVETVVFS